eukprot:GFYU01022217.1.p1 GENE.GFYU01022217.1~~GFYU01022217.1.p1  ORF type:complete len:575 (-),score=62.68 GFYU01022217.1:38-1762(-)
MWSKEHTTTHVPMRLILLLLALWSQESECIARVRPRERSSNHVHTHTQRTTQQPPKSHPSHKSSAGPIGGEQSRGVEGKTLVRHKPTVPFGSSGGEDFMEYLKSEGFRADRIRLGNCGERGQCLIATKDIDPNYVVMRIPKTVILTGKDIGKYYPDEYRILEQALSTLTAKRLFARHNEANDMITAMYLALEKIKGERSSFAPYINSLPAFVPNLQALNTTDFQWIRDALPATAKEMWVVERKNHLRRLRYVDEKLFKAHPNLFPRKLRSVFLWCLTMVHTRGLRGEDTNNLIPFLDVANHDFNGSVYGLNPNGPGQYVMVTVSRAFRAGEEVTFNYGPHNSMEFLSNSAMSLSYNYFDAAYIDIVVPDTPMVRFMMQLPKHTQIVDIGDNQVSITLYVHQWAIHTTIFQIMRFLSMGKKESASFLRRAQNNRKEWGQYGKISAENDRKALTLLRSHIENSKDYQRMKAMGQKLKAERSYIKKTVGGALLEFVRVCERAMFILGHCDSFPQCEATFRDGISPELLSRVLNKEHITQGDPAKLMSVLQASEQRANADRQYDAVHQSTTETARDEL